MEIWDLYDCERVKTGETICRGEPMPAGRYRLVVAVCVFDSGGRMLIQRRQRFKHGWSGYWDFTAGGCAISGDSSRAAAEREVREEIGYPIDLSGERPTITMHFRDGFCDIYLVHRDLDITQLELQREEVEAVKWATKDEILDMIAAGDFIPYHKCMIELLFYTKDTRTMRTRKDDGLPRV